MPSQQTTNIAIAICVIIALLLVGYYIMYYKGGSVIGMAPMAPAVTTTPAAPVSSGETFCGGYDQLCTCSGNEQFSDNIHDAVLSQVSQGY